MRSRSFKLLLLLIPLFLFSTMVLSNPSVIRLQRGENEPGEEEMAYVNFPHWSHQKLFKCYTCHPAIWTYEKQDMSMEDFKGGKYCGVCHNGNISWDIEKAECEVCHR